MPTTALVIGAVAAVVGTVVNIAGQVSAGKAQQEAGDIAATQAESDAAYVRDITKEEVRKFRRQAEKFQSTQKTAIGGSGLRMSGSALQLLQETEIEIERDIKSIKKAGRQRAQGIEAQGDIYKVQGQAALSAGIIGAGSTLLSGISGFTGSFPARTTSSSSQFNPLGYNPFGV